ncbi:MAG: hypothetical protein QXT64_00135 [Desulfurococcaceae archaeon]
MAILEALDPEFVRLLIEQISLYLSSMRYLSSFIIFDDSSRLITRVGYIDDGYVRIRDAQDTSISIVEILREMTWTSLSLAQLGATTAQPGDQPPPNVIVTGGFDGSLVRMLKTDSDGRLQVGVVSLPVTKGDWLSVIPNPPNLDVALSTRASEATLVAIRDRLPASLTSAGNFRVAVLEDGIGLAKDSTLSSILSRLDTNLSTRASETTLSGIKSQTDKLTFDASNRLIVNATVVANLDRSLLTVKRELLTLAPASGRNATVPVDDYVHWIDSAEYSVTETSWTEKTRCVVRQRNLPSRTYLVHVYVEGYVSAGQTLYVRFRSHYRGTLASFTFTETSYVSKEANATYIAPGWWDDPIYVEAYVTGGTGYVKNAQINFVKANVVEGWTGTISGEQFKPLRIDAEGYLLAKSPQLPSTLTAAGNLKVSVEESSIKQPVNIQDHWVESVVLLPSGARTASGNTGDIDVGRFLYGEICIDITAVSGTNPTLDVYIEGKDQYTGKYKVLFSHTGLNSVQTIWDTITLLAFRYLRVRWVVGGTSPSFTFSVSGEFKS